ncbi:hypothetical protein FXO38_35457 [Capsicum annuum]|nr:hypothetical protein FXO38_35457 [Capsicum annuum]
MRFLHHLYMWRHLIGLEFDWNATSLNEFGLQGEVLQEENEAECSNVDQKLQFSAVLQATPPMEEDLNKTKSTPAGNRQVQKDEMLRFMPLWVVLPGLPIYYWVEDNLNRIASYIGKPICADRLTAEVERILYAWMLIEVDITQELPEEIYIEKHDGTIHTQAIEFEWAP